MLQVVMAAAVGSEIAFLNALNEYGGMVSFATMTYIIASDQWRLKLSMKYLILAMLYCDCFAFVFGWTAMMWSDYLSDCGTLSIWFIADTIWSFKDALKYAFLVFRTVKTAMPLYKHVNAVVAAAASISLLLYWIFMAQVYDFSNSCKGSGTQTAVVWSRPALYIYWSLVDLFTGGVMITTLLTYKSQLAETTASTGGDDIYARLARREQIRLAIGGTGGMIVTVIALVNVFAKAKHPNLNAFVFVMTQCMMVAGSIGTSAKPGDKSKSKQTQSQNKSPSKTPRVENSKANMIAGGNRTPNQE